MRVAFPISEELRQRVEAVFEQAIAEDEPESQVPVLTQTVIELIDAGLGFYFLEPLKRAKVGTVGMSAARLAVGSAGRTLPALVRRILNSLSAEQLQVIVDFLGEILIDEGTPPADPLETKP